MQNPPRVTVYITNHNYGCFLRQAIDSVLNQTLQDFELIIIDDGSVDESRAVIESYDRSPKIRSIFQKNRGLNVSNNIAWRTARGRYVMRLDADDWLDPHAIEILSNVLERNASVGLVFPDYYLVDREGALLKQVHRHNFTEVTLKDQPANGACTMIRRDCLQQVGGYDETFRCQDGFDLWLRFIQHFEVRSVNLPLFFYRQHGNSLTSNEELILRTRAAIVQRVVESRRKSLNVLAVVPDRGGNVDPNSMALMKLGDKPLLDWTLSAALAARRIKRVVVSSSDATVLDHVSRTAGNSVIALERPLALAKENTSLIDTLQHALETVEASGEHFDAVYQLTTESPFREGHHIDTAIELMELFETDVVIGIRPETDNFYRHNGHGLMALSNPNALRLEREELYREAGSMRLLRREWLYQLGNGQPRIGHMVLGRRAAVQLMSPFDWTVAEFLANVADEELRIAGRARC